MRNKLRTALFLVIAIYALESFAQTDSSASITSGALEMRNSIDQFLLKNIGNNPLTLKEKYLAKQIDSLLKVSQLQSNLISELKQGNVQGNQGLNTNPIAKTDTLFFAYNNARLSLLEIEKLKNLLLSNPNKDIQIIGSADAFGSARYNHLLAMQRALFVKNQIEKMGHTGQVIVRANAYNAEAKGNFAAKYRMVTIQFF
ncbi:MAG: OmpA family protein [Bacteroidota bacterium]|nr:OmpA family protein [Bacteroidota bacterium]